MALGYAWFDSYDSVGYVLTLHISPPYILPIQAYEEDYAKWQLVQRVGRRFWVLQVYAWRRQAVRILTAWWRYVPRD